MTALARQALTSAPHWTGRAHGTSRPVGSRNLEEYLTLDGPYIKTFKLKQKLLAAGLLVNKCSICGQGPEWSGRPLVLQLDHKNGNNRDNRIENLRIICPNCHTQTDTFTGRNLSAKYRKRVHLCVCGKQIHRQSVACVKCNGAAIEAKDWPKAEDLADEVERTTYKEVAARLGKSANGLKKYLRRHLGAVPIKKRGPPSGYSARVRPLHLVRVSIPLPPGENRGS